MKKSVKKKGLIGVNEKDLETGPWLVVSTPDDLFKHNVDIKFSKLNYQPLLFNWNDLNDACSSKGVNLCSHRFFFFCINFNNAFFFDYL